MNYDTIISRYEKLTDMLEEVQTKLTEIRGEVIYTVNLISTEYFISEKVRDLFISYNIKFVPGSKESYLKEIRNKAESAKWRPKTVKDFLTKFNQIYEEPEKIVQPNDEKNLRRVLNRYGIILENDFRRSTILDLVNKKAKDQKWRPETFIKNLDLITKTIDKHPLVTDIIEPMYVHLTTEDLGLNMEGSKFD